MTADAASASGCFLGVDAGNTKTVALLVDAQGRALAWGRGGRSNIYVSVRAAMASLDRACTGALSTVDPARVSAVTLSAAGADWPEDFQLLSAELSGRFPKARCAVVNDAVGVLFAGAPSGAAVAVACGTSAGIAARNAQGKTWHTSYWQEPEGAEELGRRTLRAIYRADLGIDPPTALTSKVLSLYGLPTPEALLHAFTRRNRRLPGRVGRLARVLLDAAVEGDATAARIVDEHGAALGDYALAAARRAELEGPFALMTAGGVMRHSSKRLQQALVAHVQERVPGVRWCESPFEPVVGAALHALAGAGALAPEELHGALRDTLPDATVFET